MPLVEQDPQQLQRLAIRSQCEEIARFRKELSTRLGRPVSLDEAARAWIPSYASEWRAEFEAGIAAARRPVNFIAAFPVEPAKRCTSIDTDATTPRSNP